MDGVVNQYKVYEDLSIEDRLKITTVMVELALETVVSGEKFRQTFTSAVQLRNRNL